MTEKNEAEKAVDELMERLPTTLNVNVLYNEIIGMTNIEKAQEEDYVLRELLRGKTKNQIIENLKVKYKDDSRNLKFNYDDLEKFLSKNQEVVRAMNKEVTITARRHLEARTQCAEMLAGVALYTQHLIKDFRNEGDNTNTVAAIRALNTTLENYMKLEGLVGPDQEGGKVVNVIQTVSDTKSKLRDRIHNANFVDVTPKDDDNG